jgi:single-stranded-DNA-specific exonuclease
VVGIVASKLVETFRVPAIVLCDAQDKVDGQKVIKGSARSAGELHLFDTLNACKEHFIKFGGHKAACGMSLLHENLGAFKKAFSAHLFQIPESIRTKTTGFDIEIPLHEIGPSLVKQLEILEPFGMGNPRPNFKITDIKLESYQLMKDVHVRWNFQSRSHSTPPIKGVSFNYVGKWGKIHPQKLIERQASDNLSIIGTLQINRFRGSEKIQIMVEEIIL